MSGATHVGIVCDVFGKPIVYESTSFERPPCVRTNREKPYGVQAHYLSDIVSAGGDVWHFPLRSPLYEDEERRLLEVLEFYLNFGYDYLGAVKSGGGLVMRTVQRWISKEDMGSIFCSELAVRALLTVGRIQTPNASAWSPQRLARFVYRQGICESGVLLS
jgi:hypothetical protein